MSHSADPWSRPSASGHAASEGLSAPVAYQPPYDPDQQPGHQQGVRYGQGNAYQYPSQPYAPNPYQAYGPQPHPQAILILVLGILGFFTLGITGLLAWIFGRKALREIDANPAAYADRSQVQVGHVLGIVSTLLNAAGILAYVVFLVFYFVMMMTIMTSLPR